MTRCLLPLLALSLIWTAAPSALEGAAHSDNTQSVNTGIHVRAGLAILQSATFGPRTYRTPWWGKIAMCLPGEVVTSVCTSGKDPDCPNGFYFTRVGCSRISFD